MLIQTGTNSVPQTATGTAQQSGFITTTTVPNSQAGVYYGGYYCNQCGTWVSSGTYHVCSGVYPNNGLTGYTYYWPNNRDAEILAELKGIRQVLEGKALTELAKRIEALEAQSVQAEVEWKEWQTP